MRDNAIGVIVVVILGGAAAAFSCVAGADEARKAEEQRQNPCPVGMRMVASDAPPEPIGGGDVKVVRTYTCSWPKGTP